MRLVSLAVSSAAVAVANDSTCQDSVCDAEDGTALLQVRAPISSADNVKGKTPLANVLLQTTKDIADKVNSGQDPAECSEALNTVHEALTAALPAIYDQHTHHQNLIDIAAHNVEECASREVDGEAMIAQQAIDLQASRSSHASCRQREDARDGEEYCHQYENLRNTHGSNMCFPLPEEEESIAWVNAMESARDAAQTALDEGIRLNGLCGQFRADHAATQSECTQGQSQFELNYCAHRASCADMEICHARAEENFVSVSGEVEAAMEDVVAEFLVLKHVECLLGQANEALASSSAISSDVCNTAADTSELNIDYPTFPALQTCESTVLTTPPCKSGFFDAEYASFGQREAMEEACVACSPIPLAEAPRSWIQHHGLSHVDLDNLQCSPGSPAGCTATLVQLNGEYSPGPLVRVDNGHTTYRRTDQNSCPEGFKIYSPRTADDWRTIEASVNFNDFNSPYNIVDVTRPSQGCGGCTSNAMNSDNAAQVGSGWTTDDGSPWFLRHGSFGEPNGDYTANCYLHLWSPSNGEVYFNDGSCHYHSNKYLCQLRIDYEPAAPASVTTLDTSAVPIEGVHAWFSVDTFDANAQMWMDKSGNGFHATVTGTPLQLVEEETGPALHGTYSTQVDFGEVIPSTFTIAAVTRYRQGLHGRILTGGNFNWLAGHYHNNNCAAFYEGWKTPWQNGGNEQWQVFIGQNGESSIQMCNGASVGTATGGRGNSGLRINSGPQPEGSRTWSDFAVREIITWNRALSQEEIDAVNQYLSH